MASASSKTASATTVPQALQSSIPSCAWSCFSNYIRDNYPASTCADSNDVDCLCSHVGEQGFALQEGAFVCAHQHCVGLASQAAVDATYDICNGKPGAISATHTLLPTAFTARPSPTPSSTTTSRSTTATATSTSTTSSTSTNAVASAKPSTASQSHGLQTSQIIGISVACAATLIVAVIIAIFLACMRRRKRHHEKLDSGKLSYAEFKPPSIAEKRIVPGPSGLKDPRGGVGGVGVVPVRYKAILPPANLFAQIHNPAPQPIPHATRNVESAAIPIPPLPPVRNGREQQGPPVTETPAPERILSGVTSIASSHYSTQSSVIQPNHHNGSEVARLPSVLVPGRNNLAPIVRPANERDSSASQITQFEEDGPMQNPMIPAAAMTRPRFTHEDSSDSSVPSSQETSCSTSSSTPSARKSRGPSLRISIPGKRRSHFDFPPPPARPPVNEINAQRPSLTTAGAALLPYVPTEITTGEIAQREQRQYPQRSRAPTVTITSASPPRQFPAPMSGRIVAEAPAPISHKESVSRRGFSQPNTTAFVHASQSHQTTGPRVRPANDAQLTVNGERINYPTIPKPSMSPPRSFPMPSPPTSQPTFVPPPPPGPPPMLADPYMAGSGGIYHRATPSNASSAESLLTKRRGSERAAALERQLKIHNSHGSTSHLPGTAGPSNISAGHTRVDSKTTPMQPLGTQDRHVRPAAAATQPWPSPPPMNNVRQWPSAAHVRQGSGNQRWMAPGSEQVAQGRAQAQQRQQQQQQQQYVAYQFPPLPSRPGVQNVQPPLMSPTPAQLTPTRRGGDMYLSVQ